MAEERDMVVVVSKVKDFIKSKECMTAGDFPEALSKAVYDILEKACARAKANKRSTVRPEDI
ncbi:MAG: hypothetical protein GYA21_16430 [Myxococcales bacterium]|nr:hypothetical protein [Myxococcales bacterium]